MNEACKIVETRHHCRGLPLTNTFHIPSRTVPPIHEQQQVDMYCLPKLQLQSAGYLENLRAWLRVAIDDAMLSMSARAGSVKFTLSTFSQRAFELVASRKHTLLFVSLAPTCLQRCSGPVFTRRAPRRYFTMLGVLARTSDIYAATSTPRDAACISRREQPIG